ncbi:MAG: adenine phosphoribosyltransferase [Candidatus Omnitrophica bacterium]|nr:adenine phosphoribosyltransferase [Candidatus Omnitrophota bacterium]
MKTDLDLSAYIRNIPDFPKEGIQFKDITTLLKDKEAFRQAVDLLVAEYKDKKIDSVVAVEARGFILGGAVAHGLGAGFVPVRKKGKLPAKTSSVTYELEYGTDTLEMHEDALNAGDRVLIVDDLLATGGTVRAVTELLDKMEAGIMGIAFLIELSFLNGREKIKDYPITALIKY